MKSAVRATLGALEIAGSLCGVPYVGAAAIVLQEIVRACDNIRIHKLKSQHMIAKCTQLLNVLNDQSSRLVGSDLQESADQVTAVFETIQSRVRQWSRYNRVKCFVKATDIVEGLDLCDKELDAAMSTFHLNANIVLHHQQRENTALIRNDNHEMCGLLHEILTSQRELRRVCEMQSAGEHVAEPIMEAGQNELRLLRENTLDRGELMITDVRSTSPSSQTNDSQRYLQYQRGLINLHRLTGIPPSVKVLDGEVTRTGDLAVAGGTYSDIWLGIWLGEEKVALKALRNIKASDPKAKKRFEREIYVWAELNHRNILPFYGIVTDLGQHIQMVSPWQDHGNVLDYVKTFPSADRLHLLVGAANGLDYLHSCNIIHGNVKCANILVSKEGEARICDFGMSKVIEEVTEKSASATLTASGSARWLAPELIEGVVSSPTKEADTYSYSMAILELLTGKYPFHHRRRDASVIHDIVVLKKTPPRPDDADASIRLSDPLWKLMQECWHSHAGSRPSMAQVAAYMRVVETNAAEEDSMVVS